MSTFRDNLVALCKDFTSVRGFHLRAAREEALGCAMAGMHSCKYDIGGDVPNDMVLEIANSFRNQGCKVVVTPAENGRDHYTLRIRWHG